MIDREFQILLEIGKSKEVLTVKKDTSEAFFSYLLLAHFVDLLAHSYKLHNFFERSWSKFVDVAALYAHIFWID